MHCRTSSDPVDPLVVAISSRALFDLEDSHALFEREGLEAYADFQRAHEDDLLAPGVAFPLVRKLLALNEGCPTGHDGQPAPRVEVILISRNSADTGLRIFNSIAHHGLGIRRAAFSNGAAPYPYIRPFASDLFLSTHAEDVAKALDAGVAAATILPASARQSRHDQLRIAFDGDAVLFGDESERVSRLQGLEAFTRNEHERAREPLSGGPFRGFLDALQRLQAAFPPGEARRSGPPWSPRARRPRTSG
jgi:5'-nucleotidase